MNKENFRKNELFIDRMIDAIRDHYDPLSPTIDERGTSQSLWRTHTPVQYLEKTSVTVASDVQLRIQIHRALEGGQLDNALFLILTLCRTPPYLLPESLRKPWQS